MRPPDPISVEIQQLRERLESLLKSGFSIRDTEVIRVSQQMDALVMAYYEERAAGSDVT